MKFLKDDFSLNSEGYYAGIGMIYGMNFCKSIDLTMGIIFGDDNGIAVGLSRSKVVEMEFGMLIGATKDVS